MNWYLDMWRAAFVGDWYDRLSSRLLILVLHALLIVAVLLIMAAVR